MYEGPISTYALVYIQQHTAYNEWFQYFIHKHLTKYVPTDRTMFLFILFRDNADK